MATKQSKGKKRKTRLHGFFHKPSVLAFNEKKKETLVEQYERLCLARIEAEKETRLAWKQCDTTYFKKLGEKEEMKIWNCYEKCRQIATDAHRAIWDFCEGHGDVVRAYVKKHGVGVLACDTETRTKGANCNPKKPIQSLRQSTLGFKRKSAGIHHISASDKKNIRHS